MAMGDIGFSLDLRDTLKRMIREYVDLERPRPRYATVESFDRAARKCAVVYTGETGSVQVNMGSLQPSAVGQKVRIEGIGTDKYVADVIGEPYMAQLDVDRIRIRSTADVDPAGADATDPFILGDPNGVHLALDNNELVAFSGPGVPQRIALNSGAYIPDDQIPETTLSVPNLNWVINRINAQLPKIARRVIVGERAITPVANTPTRGAVTFPAGYFSEEPVIVTTANSSVPGGTVVSTSATAITTAGFDAVCYRTNTTLTGVMYVAVQMS
jgi:hypothetical protein